MYLPQTLINTQTFIRSVKGGIIFFSINRHGVKNSVNRMRFIDRFWNGRSMFASEWCEILVGLMQPR
jgi:hypothetical protein